MAGCKSCEVKMLFVSGREQYYVFNVLSTF